MPRRDIPKVVVCASQLGVQLDGLDVGVCEEARELNQNMTRIR